MVLYLLRPGFLKMRLREDAAHCNTAVPYAPCPANAALLVGTGAGGIGLVL